MKNLLSTFLLVFGLSLMTQAQLPNGSTAPDFTLTDLDGNSHNLYEYLDQGKVVFIKFFACHCPSCWAYYNTGTLESLYTSYGPSGTDQIRVLMIEHDQWNGYAEFHGTSPNTQGDWVTGNPIPIVNAEDPDRGVFTDYNMTYYPMVYKICPDKTTELMSTTLTTAELYQKADDCPGTLSLQETPEAYKIILDYTNHQIKLNNFEGISQVALFNTIGQQVRYAQGPTATQIDVTGLMNGVYFLKVEHSTGTVSKKIYIP